MMQFEVYRLRRESPITEFNAPMPYGHHPTVPYFQHSVNWEFCGRYQSNRDAADAAAALIRADNVHAIRLEPVRIPDPPK
jgi:hypothetical protein